MILNAQLYESAMEVLESLGQETMQAILWQMGTKGVNVTSDSFDIDLFATQLQDLFGDGAESLLEEIYQNIVCRMELLDSNSSFDDSVAIDGKKLGRGSGALQKIRTMFNKNNPGHLPRDGENQENDK